MGIQAFVPSGGGGTPGFDYIASIRMETYNRSWAQAGAAGNYILTSNNMNSGYVYFVGSSTTTGSPLGKVVNVAHSFTRLDIVAPTGDYMSLYKAAVKSTTLFANPFANFASFPSTISSSGNFVLPTSALPLVNVVITGGGGGGGGDHRGGGGGGGAVVSLTGYQAVGTTAVSIGGSGGHGGNNTGGTGGTTYFGNVYALGGGGGSGNQSPVVAVNTGGGNAHSGQGIATPNASLNSAGLGTQAGTSVLYAGHTGYPGYSNKGGGGGGAGASATDWNGGAGHNSSITGSNYSYGHGGGGGSHSPDNGVGTHTGGYGCGGHGAHNGGWNNASGGTQGVVVVRYYIA